MKSQWYKSCWFRKCFKPHISIYLLGLSYGTDDQSLKDAFSQFGDVVDGECLNQFVDACAS